MRVLPLFLLVAALSADDTPVFFREPDRAARAHINNALTGLHSKTRQSRRTARRALKDMGPWATGPLAKSLRGTGKELARINAAIVITQMRDAHGVGAIRHALGAQRDLGRVSCLALGYFGFVSDGERLETRLGEAKFKPKAAAVLGLARIAGTKWGPGALIDQKRPMKREKIAGQLLARSRALPKLPKDSQEAAATLLAAVIAHQDTDVTPYIADGRPLVAAAAAIGLCVRPASLQQVKVLQALLKKRAGKSSLRWLRALRFFALGYAAPRTKAIHDRLLRAVKKEGKAPQRAALLALADVSAGQASAKALLAAFAKMRATDPNRGALLFALARTGDADAIKRLREIAAEVEKSADRLAASAALLYYVCTRQPANALTIARGLREPPKLVSTVNAALGKPERLTEIAAEEFVNVGTGFEFTPTRRAFALVNRFLPVLFKLDDLKNLGEASKGNPGAGAGIGLGNGDDNGGNKNKAGRGAGGGAGIAPHEVDLIDFLRAEPYFAPEHVGSWPRNG